MKTQIKIPDQIEFPDLSIGEFMTHAVVTNKNKLHDKTLFDSKWWDYRFDSPFDATMKYIDIFGVEARKIYARDIDKETSEHIRVVTSESVMKGLLENRQTSKAAFAGFWRGRQVADALGMPYSVFIGEALSQRMRNWQRSYLPHGSQIYKDSDVKKVLARWEEIKSSRIHYSDHFGYMPENYVGAQIQIDYSDYLYERAHLTSDWLQTLVDMVEADRMSLTYLFQKHEGKFEQVRASLP